APCPRLEAGEKLLRGGAQIDQLGVESASYEAELPAFRPALLELRQAEAGAPSRALGDPDHPDRGKPRAISRLQHQPLLGSGARDGRRSAVRRTRSLQTAMARSEGWALPELRLAPP